MSDIDLDRLRSWIGRTETAHERLSAELVQRFNATLDRESPIDDGAEAPPMIHFCLAQPAVPTAGLGPEGHAHLGDFLPPVPLPRRMYAGGALEFISPIRIGEMTTRTSRVADVAVKAGRSGTLCFVTVEHRIESDGRLALTERQDIVYREAEAGAPAPAAIQPAAEAGQDSRRITPTAPLLFRYSALTFNGHRIHYDLPFVREVEGYPGLLVHGPLQATLLVLLAQQVRGSTPRRFSFRSLAPIFDTSDFTINSDADDAGLKLWTAQVGGPPAMQARAEW